MSNQDPHQRRPSDRSSEERLQVDPLLRRTGVPWGWGLVVVAAIALIAVLLFGINQEPDRVAGPPPANPPSASQSTGPLPPETEPNSARGTAKAPPASTDVTKVPAESGTTGAAQ